MNILQILKYGKTFTSDAFMSTVNRMGRNIMFARKAVMLYYCLRDNDTPKFVKAVIAGALGYLILPIDFIPDSVPGLGWVDDVAILAIAMKVANRHIKASHKEQAQKFVPIGSID